jgi:hypothetical protein
LVRSESERQKLAKMTLFPGSYRRQLIAAHTTGETTYIATVSTELRPLIISAQIAKTVVKSATSILLFLLAQKSVMVVGIGRGRAIGISQLLTLMFPAQAASATTLNVIIEIQKAKEEHAKEGK